MFDRETNDGISGPGAFCALERKCLSMAATGLEAAAIGPQIGLTAKEVEVLLYCAQRKLGAANRMQALARYLSDEITGSMGR
jgi:DNA-binding NarL/FixJ family response regulator